MRVLLAALAALLIATTSAHAAAPSLSVVGNRLVDTSTNATFIPRGVNWPSFEYACFYGYGYSNEASATQVGPTDQQAALIASWHANVVRVPLNQDCWLGQDGSPSGGLTAAGYRDAVAAWVAKLHAAGLAVILDLHWSGPSGVKADGQKMMADQDSVAFWSSVAARFKDDRAVLFDAFNEPYSRGDGTFSLSWTCWQGGGCPAARNSDDKDTPGGNFLVFGMQQLVTAIRGAGAPQPILLGGLDYANDLREWLTHKPNDPQLVASFHNYNGQRCDTQSCWDAEIAPVAAQVPLVTGEFAEDDCKTTHDTSYMNWADAHGVGYLMWQWVVLAADEKRDPPCASFQIISDTAGTPAEPNGTTFKAHLAALAATPGTGGPTGPSGPSGPTGPTLPPVPIAAPPNRAKDTRAPSLAKLSLARRKGAVRLTLTLSERARLTATLARRGKRVARTTRTLGPGRHTVSVTRKRLARGTYKLTLTATDAAGNRAKSRTLSLRVR